MREEILYFLEDEFANKIIDEGTVRQGISHEEMMSQFNHDCFSPVDGQIIRACDKLAAFIEASLSIQHGIKSRNLVEGKAYIYERYRREKIGSMDFGRLFDSFV
jgi:putative hydrolases of HD superfamily